MTGPGELENITQIIQSDGLNLNVLVFFRFGESKVELDALLTDEQLSSCPILILGNKIDRPGAAGEDELRQVFGLYGQTTGRGRVARSELYGRPLELFMCSVLKRQGYGEGFRWISQYLD